MRYESSNRPYLTIGYYGPFRFEQSSQPSHLVAEGLDLNNLITIEEVGQIFISKRTFDLLDLFCSYLGIIAGDIAVKYMEREKVKRL
ncbi:MAG: hypothetical protein FP814_16495 [Desulfobacterium sp.]|nr:hypothetical protein [Desulfobacterium sp.]MBU3946810.1 glucokinase [Pseudomonadota bacterium]MBU4010161.1 glucokinase [Pseudomonadota bacterium]